MIYGRKGFFLQSLQSCSVSAMSTALLSMKVGSCSFSTKRGLFFGMNCFDLDFMCFAVYDSKKKLHMVLELVRPCCSNYSILSYNTCRKHKTDKSVRPSNFIKVFLRA